MTDTPLNGRRVSLEKSFRLTANADLQRNIVTYLKVLRSQRYSKLLSPDNTDNVDRLIGELRVIQKLLDVLELESEPLSDSLLMSQSS